MANPNAAHEPSMEEILASIRQIISEDSDVAPPVRPEAKGARPASEPAAKAEVEQPSPAASESAPSGPLASRAASDHAEPMKPSVSETAKASSERAGLPQPAAAAREQGRAATAPVHAATSQGAVSRAAEPGKLLSEDSKAAVAGAFGALAHTIFAQNARTLEDLVAEMLRPMLKGWLDDNLPPLVERLVKEEIERVSRGRR